MLYLKLLGIMLLARLPLLDALAVLRDMEEDEEMTKAIKKTMSSLAGAAAFYESLDEAFLDPFIRDTVAFATGLGEAKLSKRSPIGRTQDCSVTLGHTEPRGKQSHSLMFLYLITFLAIS